MKKLQLATLASFCLIAAMEAPLAVADSVKHDFLNIAAAKRDIAKLKRERARAVRYKNWGKVAQEDRLIQSDRFWIKRYRHRIHDARR
jgi:hypothetical protein